MGYASIGGMMVVIGVGILGMGGGLLSFGVWLIKEIIK